MIRRFESKDHPHIWAEFKQLPDLSFQYRDWINDSWIGVGLLSWHEVEIWAQGHILFENHIQNMGRNLPQVPKCDCGGEKSSGPGCHSHWCQTLQKTQVGA